MGFLLRYTGDEAPADEFIPSPIFKKHWTPGGRLPTTRVVGRCVTDYHQHCRYEELLLVSDEER
jgi:hypothetical protein